MFLSQQIEILSLNLNSLLQEPLLALMQSADVIAVGGALRCF